MAWGELPFRNYPAHFLRTSVSAVRTHMPCREVSIVVASSSCRNTSGRVTRVIGIDADSRSERRTSIRVKFAQKYVKSHRVFFNSR